MSAHTLEKIRSEVGNKTVNIIMLTTESDAGMKERGASIIGGGPMQFVHPKSSHGVLLQMFEKKA